ncbi:MAG: PIN domain-containing protein [Alphaproteobacteria bacterium]|nr:PIN domain-containing protein [Alphaproteobacteria bacterium]
MAFLIDTDVAIHLRDGDAGVTAKIGALDDAILMSIVTRVELEGGVYRIPAQASVRRARLDVILKAIPALAFDADAADAYSAIVAHAGYSRRKLLDRMIAAQALVHRSTLVTLNGADYTDVPNLKLLAL